jgi:hypothetical protein
MSQVHFSRSGFHWLGPLLVAALLRQRGKVASHFLCLNAGLRIVPRERRRAQEKATRLHAGLDAFAEAASAGLKELDRLVMAKSQMERRLRNRRKSSSLPALIELVLARPVVSAGLIAAELKNGRAQLCRDTVRAGQADGAWPQIKEAGPAAGARSQESRCIKGAATPAFGDRRGKIPDRAADIRCSKKWPCARRTNSKLPALVELVLARPLVSTGMIQEKLKVSKHGALNLVGEFSLREMTGRGVSGVGRGVIDPRQG